MNHIDLRKFVFAVVLAVPSLAQAAPESVPVPTGTLYRDQKAGWACFLPAGQMQVSERSEGQGEARILRLVQVSGEGARSENTKVDATIPGEVLGERAKSFELCLLTHDKSLPYKVRMAALQRYVESLTSEELARATEELKLLRDELKSQAAEIARLKRENKELANKRWDALVKVEDLEAALKDLSEKHQREMAGAAEKAANEVAALNEQHAAEKRLLVEIIETQTVILTALQPGDALVPPAATTATAAEASNKPA